MCSSISVAELDQRRNSPTSWIRSTVMSKRSKVTLFGIDRSLMLSDRGRELCGLQDIYCTFPDVKLGVVIGFFGLVIVLHVVCKHGIES